MSISRIKLIFSAFDGTNFYCWGSMSDVLGSLAVSASPFFTVKHVKILPYSNQLALVIARCGTRPQPLTASRRDLAYRRSAE